LFKKLISVQSPNLSQEYIQNFTMKIDMQGVTPLSSTLNATDENDCASFSTLIAGLWAHDTPTQDDTTNCISVIKTLSFKNVGWKEDKLVTWDLSGSRMLKCTIPIDESLLVALLELWNANLKAAAKRCFDLEVNENLEIKAAEVRSLVNLRTCLTTKVQMLLFRAIRLDSTMTKFAQLGSHVTIKKGIVTKEWTSRNSKLSTEPLHIPYLNESNEHKKLFVSCPEFTLDFGKGRCTIQLDDEMSMIQEALMQFGLLGMSTEKESIQVL